MAADAAKIRGTKAVLINAHAPVPGLADALLANRAVPSCSLITRAMHKGRPLLDQVICCTNRLCSAMPSDRTR